MREASRRSTPPLNDIATGRLWYRGRLIGSFEVPVSEYADFAAALEADGTTAVERTDEVE
jgi:hypothetical protein